MPTKTSPDPELLAVKALGFLAETPELLVRFMGLSGATPADLRDRIGDPGFLGGVLDFLLENDETTAAFCTAENIDPRSIHWARQQLSGGGRN
ncbi:MAG TPA: DUF3572 domain-containing protein [Rhizomicrobium sp.]|jgi:hypothetical protein